MAGNPGKKALFGAVPETCGLQGATGIEPVTPTMSTQCVDGNYSEIRIQSAGKDRIRSRSDHGNLGRFLGPLIVQGDDGQWSIGWRVVVPGPFESRTFALAVAARQVVSA